MDGDRPKVRVLALDDEHYLLQFLERVLMRAGYETIVTTNPEQVVRARTIRPAEPGTWVAILERHGKSAIVVCECLALISLKDYVIHGDGIVSPQVQCPICGAIQQLRLVGWAVAA